MARRHLTERQVDVLRAAAEGLTTKEIAARMQLRERTVKWHLTRIFARLGAQNRTEAVSIAYEVGAIASVRQEANDGEPLHLGRDRT